MMCVTFCYLQVSSFLFPASEWLEYIVPVSMQHFQGEQTSKHKGKANLIHNVKFHSFQFLSIQGKTKLIFVCTQVTYDVFTYSRYSVLRYVFKVGSLVYLMIAIRLCDLFSHYKSMQVG